jgi:tRNA A-37 threonylcarbamoyl transferase component Bud32
MPTVRSGDTASVRWQMSAGLRERLPGANGIRLDEWLRDDRADVVKDGPHRAVYCAWLSGLSCHIKHYRLLGWRSRVRELFRPIKARREYERALALQARGVPTPVPLAWGVEGAGVGPCASWLVTETVVNTQPLLSFLEETLPRLPESRQAKVRQRLAHALGWLLAHMHECGVVHHDLHPGNLLISLNPGDEPHLWLIDLHAVTLSQPCSWKVGRANLVVFNRYFILRASRADRLRFWHSYRAARAGIVPEPECQAPRELERLTDQSNLRFWQARDRRCLLSNRYYRRVCSGAVRGHAVRDLGPDALTPLLADPDGPFAQPGVRHLKDSRSSTVVELDLPVGGVTRRVVYKRFRVIDRRDPILGLLRRTAALRSWVLGHGLRERCLPTPRPLAVLHRHTGGLPREGYLLADKIEAATDLHTFLGRLTVQSPQCQTTELRHRVEALARLLREFHRRGLSHRDLKAPNLLTAEAPGDARFWFIDLVGVRRHAHVGQRRRAKDLARLHASFVRHMLLTRTEKLRFLRAYLCWGLWGKSGWKNWWRVIDAVTRAKVAKNTRIGRPLA